MKASAQEKPGARLDLRFKVRKSPTEGAPPPAGAVVLFPYEPGTPPRNNVSNLTLVNVLFAKTTETWNLGSSVEVSMAPDKRTVIALESGCGSTRVMMNVLASSITPSSFTFHPIGCHRRQWEPVRAGCCVTAMAFRPLLDVNQDFGPITLLAASERSPASNPPLESPTARFRG